MAKEFFSLSERDRQKIIKLLNERKCGHANYIITEALLSLPVVPPMDNQGRERAYPVIAFYCKDCGFVQLYDAGKLNELVSLTFD